jgi:hypothetical protein
MTSEYPDKFGVVDFPFDRTDNKRSKFQIIPFRDLRPGTGRNYTVKGLIPRTGTVIVWGPPKCGKSFWTFDLMMHVALDWLYRSRRVVHGAVVYCPFEGAEGFKARAEAFRRHHKLDPKRDVPFFLLPSHAKLVRDHKALIEAIRAQSIAPIAVVLDTLNRSIDGSESKDEDMGAYLSAAEAIEEAFDCVVIIVHHCGVDGSRPRGHTSLTGNTETQLAIKRDTEKNVVVTIEYMKDGPEGDQFVSRLETVNIGVDDDEDTMYSCVVVESEALAANMTGDSLSKNQKTMFSILYDAGSQGLTLADWNKVARDAGIGVNRKADLFDLRTALHAKKMIYESNGRWIARREA